MRVSGIYKHAFYSLGYRILMLNGIIGYIKHYYVWGKVWEYFLWPLDFFMVAWYNTGLDYNSSWGF